MENIAKARKRQFINFFWSQLLCFVWSIIIFLRLFCLRIYWVNLSLELVWSNTAGCRGAQTGAKIHSKNWRRNACILWCLLLKAEDCIVPKQLETIWFWDYIIHWDLHCFKMSKSPFDVKEVGGKEGIGTGALENCFDCQGPYKMFLSWALSNNPGPRKEHTNLFTPFSEPSSSYLSEATQPE